MDGILNILKPANMTSHQVVAYVRRTLKMKKVGHTGTLDPNAMGILPICIGKATRVSEYVMDLEKRYRAQIAFGKISDTGDLYGNVIETGSERVECDEIVRILEKYKGVITQTPPMASAIKVKGKKLYEYYRQGQDVDIPKREVHIYDISLIDEHPKTPNTCYIDVHCSKGTYIRTLCQDIGNDLNVGALMSYLLRTAVGPFTIENSLFLHQLNDANLQDYLFPIDTVLTHYPKVNLAQHDCIKIKNGVSVNIQNVFLHQQLIRIYNEKDEFIALCINNNGNLKPHKVFA